MLFRRSYGIIFGALALLGSLAGGTAFGADWKILPGHVPAAIAHFNPLGRLPATNQMRLAIGVPLRDPAGLNQFLAQLYDPASPNYRQYLTPEEFTARFGPTEQDYEAVEQFARANGLTVVETHGNRMVLDVAGPAAAVEKAFQVKLQVYQHPTESRQFFAPDTEPTVAAALPVADIQGLSDFSKPHPRLKKSNATNVPRDGSGPQGGAYFGNDFRNAYASGTTLTGAGQSVGLLEFDGYYPSDIASYAAAAGGGRANITIQRVLLDGFDGTPTRGSDSGDGEVSLDIEMSMAMAPGLSKIVVFEAGPNGLQNDVLTSMVQSNTVKSLACCWGWSGGPSTTTDNLFQELDAQGQSFFNASGDSYAFTVGADSVNGVDNPNPNLANAPSSSPYITQVGGTTLTMNGTGASYGSEIVWSWSDEQGGSSGGVSSYYPLPTWQEGVSTSANQGSTTHRNIPDVAMISDSVFVYDSNGSSDVFGGTSCAAPLWAGFIALVNQQAASLGKSPAGFINPAIYTIGKGQNSSYTYAACFHDTTTGNNFWPSSPHQYSAVPGYDLCTGWGTPNGVSLINALAGQANSVPPPTGTLSISPLTGFASSGFAGGPFTPASGVFQLNNGSASAVKWSLVSTSAWLKVQFTSGTLAANSTTNITVDIAASANTLKPKNYSSSLKLSNLSAHTVQLIPFTLQVEQAISMSSTQGFTAVGPVHGPFTTNSEDFVLTNLAGSALKWSVTKPASWLVVSPASGTIPAGGQATVTASLAASADTLKAAVYKTSISFSDAAGVIATVPFTLSIGQPLVENGGFETGNFTGWTQSGNAEFTTVVRANSSYVHSGTYGAQLGPGGSPGYLSQTLMTAVGQTYKVSLWLRNPTNAMPNWFQMQWNGTVLFEQTNIPGKGWTNLQFLATATSTSSTLQLCFQNDPGFFGLDDISVTPVTNANASIKAAVRKSTDFQLVWSTTVGSLYQVQYKTNLFQPDWINLGSTTKASADTLIITDTNAFQSSPQRFYRLQVVPSP